MPPNKRAQDNNVYAQNSEEHKEMTNFFIQRLTKTPSGQSGIALIEILVVVGIVVALAAIVLPFYS